MISFSARFVKRMSVKEREEPQNMSYHSHWREKRGFIEMNGEWKMENGE